MSGYNWEIVRVDPEGVAIPRSAMLYTIENRPPSVLVEQLAQLEQDAELPYELRRQSVGNWMKWEPAKRARTQPPADGQAVVCFRSIDGYQSGGAVVVEAFGKRYRKLLSSADIDVVQLFSPDHQPAGWHLTDEPATVPTEEG